MKSDFPTTVQLGVKMRTRFPGHIWCCPHWVKSLPPPLSNPQSHQTLFPKGFPRRHTDVRVCVGVCVLSFSMLWGRGVTWHLVPGGCCDNYSCKAVIEKTTFILGLLHQLVAPAASDLHTNTSTYLHTLAACEFVCMCKFGDWRQATISSQQPENASLLDYWEQQRGRLKLEVSYHLFLLAM